MFYLFITLIIIASVLLVFFVLIQNPKGGGLNSNFAGSNNLMGVKRTGDILEKGTWILVISIMVISLLINVTLPGTVVQADRDLVIRLIRPRFLQLRLLQQRCLAKWSQ